MKTDGLLYSGQSKKQASDKFLSKEELRKIFPEDDEVVLTINYVRKAFKKHKPEEFGSKGKTSKKQLYHKPNYPKSYNKSRVILL